MASAACTLARAPRSCTGCGRSPTRAAGRLRAVGLEIRVVWPAARERSAAPLGAVLQVARLEAAHECIESMGHEGLVAGQGGVLNRHPVGRFGHEPGAEHPDVGRLTPSPAVSSAPTGGSTLARSSLGRLRAGARAVAQPRRAARRTNSVRRGRCRPRCVQSGRRCRRPPGCEPPVECERPRCGVGGLGSVHRGVEHSAHHLEWRLPAVDPVGQRCPPVGSERRVRTTPSASAWGRPPGRLEGVPPSIDWVVIAVEVGQSAAIRRPSPVREPARMRAASRIRRVPSRSGRGATRMNREPLVRVVTMLGPRR